jgi:hypothetical protein
MFLLLKRLNQIAKLLNLILIKNEKSYLQKGIIASQI